MSNSKMSYANRFFMSDDKEDTSYLACDVRVGVSEAGEYPSSSFEANFNIYDGFEKISLHAFSYSKSDEDIDDFIRKLHCIRDACNTMIEKTEEAKAIHEKFQAKISEE